MTININASPAPGSYVVEQLSGFIPAAISDHSCCYMLGTATTGDLNVPVQITSTDDFNNVFGTSPCLKHIKLFFDNDPLGRLFFCRIDATDINAPTQTECVDGIAATAFEPELQQGFLIFPLAFETLDSTVARNSVANEMRTIVEDADLQWVALIDAHSDVVDTTTATAEFTGVSSVRGHLAVFAPLLRNLNDEVVAPSPAVAATATLRYREQGFYQPPAGIAYPLKGVASLETKFTRGQQEALNPLGINLIRQLPGKGIVIYGSRAKTNDSLFLFINQRVIFNVINKTLRQALSEVVFYAVDGRGVLFTRVKETASQVMYRLWVAGALYGSDPNSAYLVVCDDTNNPAIDLENGVVRVDVFATPSPTVERVLGTLTRVPIGSVILNLQ